MSEPIAKRDNQRDKVLIWLQMRGARGVLNTELNEICLRYGARIHELRAAGHNITTHKLDDSRYRFVLEPLQCCAANAEVKDYTQAVQERLFA